MEILPGVVKTIVHLGKQDFREDFIASTKVTFHFKTIKVDEKTGSENVLDDSKTVGVPMELIFGKKFKMPVWESCLKSMFAGEIAKFEVDKELVYSYPFVSQTYRQFSGRKPSRPLNHCCGMMAMQQGMGFPDLDTVFRNPTDLVFIIELLTVKKDGNYTKESWAMEPGEKLSRVPKLKEEGNQFYNKGEFKKASLKYQEALQYLEVLTLREKPGSCEWLQLEHEKVPLLLNYSQCKLLEKDYYTAIEHTTTVLQKEPDNVKALFRRGKAHRGAWNPTEARQDFSRVKTLDPSLTNLVNDELKKLEEEEFKKELKDREQYKGKMF